jgi:hypothetical protein
MITPSVHYDAAYLVDNAPVFRPVVAFSDTGEALVVEPSTGRLVEANSLPGFRGVYENRERGRKRRKGTPETKSITPPLNGPQHGPQGREVN